MNQQTTVSRIWKLMQKREDLTTISHTRCEREQAHCHNFAATFQQMTSAWLYYFDFLGLHQMANQQTENVAPRILLLVTIMKISLFTSHKTLEMYEPRSGAGDRNGVPVFERALFKVCLEKCSCFPFLAITKCHYLLPCNTYPAVLDDIPTYHKKLY